MFKIVVEPEAIKDIDNACSYFSSLPIDTVNLNNNFLDDIQLAFKILKINPFYQVKTKNYRAFPLRKFPYILFFKIDEEKKIITILALFNTNQNINKYP